MKKITSLAFAMIACTFSASAYSAEFSSIIDAIAIPKNVIYTDNSWESAEKIKGVDWQWPYYESDSHDSTMIGTIKAGATGNPDIGYTRVAIKGARTFMTDIEIYIDNEGENVLTSDINKLFGAGKVVKVPSSCDQDYATSSDATYKFSRKNEKPVFIRYGSSSGSGGGTVSMRVANHLSYLNGLDDCYDKQTIEKWDSSL